MLSLDLQGEAAVRAPLDVAGRTWLMTCVSMGNPHAITYGTADGASIKACTPSSSPYQGIIYKHNP